MILYDKKCNLLGMSRDVLGFLGYEDIEEFKTYTNDVADLFVNKSGYVYKFKNFSWIDYILHSGAPNKSALVKLKNGKEVESRISIEEIILLDPIGDNQSFYKVDLFNSYMGKGHADTLEIPSLQSITPIHAPDTQDAPPMATKEESPPEIITQEEPKEFPIVEDFEETPEVDLTQDYTEAPSSVSFESSLEEGSEPEILENTTPEPSLEATIEKLQIDQSMFDDLSEPEIKLSLDIPSDEIVEKEKVAPLPTSQLTIEEEVIKPTLSIDELDDIALEINAFKASESDSNDASMENSSSDIPMPLDQVEVDTPEIHIKEPLDSTLVNHTPISSFQEKFTNSNTPLLKEEMEIDSEESFTIDQEIDEPTIQIKNDLAADILEEHDTPIYEDVESTPLIDQAIEEIEEVPHVKPATIPEERSYLDDLSDMDIFGTYHEEQASEKSEELPIETFTLPIEEPHSAQGSEIEDKISAPKEEPYYLQEASEALGLDSDSLKELMKEYFDYIDITTHALEDSITNNEEVMIKELAQQLKSVADNLRLKELSAILEELQASPIDDAKKLFTQYQKIVDSIKGEVL